MFSSQSTLNSVGRNAGIANTSSNYWYTEDNNPYVNLYPSGSTINATDIDTTNNILYVGGSFSRLYQNNANYHSIYDVSSSAFQIKSKNYGTNGSIYAYGLDTSNSILYVGGNFTSVTDNNDMTIDASYVAAWSIKTQRWTPLGRNKQNGLNDVCNALAVDISNQEVYVGGNFTKVSDAVQVDQSANYVAKWKVSTGRWSKLGASDVSYNNGLKSMCRSLVYDSKNTQLYVGGDFTKVRDSRGIDISANRIAIWKDSQSNWNVLGNVGAASNNGTNYVAGTSGRIFSSIYDSCKNVIYVSGDFTYLYDSTNISLSANYIAYWDITNQKWGRLGTSSSNGVNSTGGSTYGLRICGFAIDSSRQILYVGGNFTTVYDGYGTLSTVNYIASWNINTQRWSRLGGSTLTTNGVQTYATSLVYDSSNNKLHVGGQFIYVYDSSNGQQTVNRIASWDISNNCWLSSFGSGVNNRVLSMAMDISNNYLWLAGNFTSVTDSSGTLTVSFCAYWNFKNSRWYPLGTTSSNGFTLNGSAALSLDSSNNIIYVYSSGSATVTFNDASWSSTALTANSIAGYNILTSRWVLLGNSTYNGLYKGGANIDCVPELALDTSNSILYVSGNFTSTYDSSNTNQSANYIAGWNIRTQTWSRLGSSASNGITNNDNTTYNGGAPISMSLDSSCNLYVGSVGSSVYDASGTMSVNGIAAWKPSTQRWSRLGVADSSKNNGLDGSCNAMVIDSSNNRLYVGGNFKRASDSSNTDLSVNNVAYWDITNSVWKTLGGTTSTTNGLDGSCNALAFDSSNNRLYVGGNFKKVSDASKSDQSANYVVFWDASNSLWGQVGAYDSSKNGVDASVNALAFDSCKNILYVGGNFLKAYDSSFTLASPLSTQYLATWNPTTKLWSRIGYSSTSRANIYGLSNFCRALTYDPSKRLVYVGGDHTSSCDSSNISVDTSNIAYINLNTGNIYPLGSTSRNGTNDKVNSIKLDTSNNVLYVDGSFTRVTDISANYIAKYDVSNSAWSSLGSSTSNGLGGMGKALFYDNTNNAVYASGNFTAVRDGKTDSSKNFNYVAKWDVAKSAWSPLGSYGNGTNGFILTYAYDAPNYRVYCGGSFTQVFDNSNTRLYANNVAVFDTNTSTWSVLGGNSVTDPSNNGINSICRTLVYDQSNSQLYVGGDFTRVRDGRGSDISANCIAIWKPSTSQWSVMGTSTRYGLDGSCNALALDSSNSRLYVGGNFKKVSDAAQADQSANCVAYWDISNSLWKQLGGTTRTTNGLDGSCNALVLDPSFTRLYVGGNFKKVSDSVKIDQSANYIAYWDISNSNWGKLGATDDSSNNGVRDIVRTLAYDNANAQVYVGGDFISARDGRGLDLSTNRVAIWKPSTNLWSGMGKVASHGTNGQVSTVTFDSSNNVMYVGGTFTEVYDTSNIRLFVNNIAAWNIATKTWSRFGSAAYNGILMNNGNYYIGSIIVNKTKLYVSGYIDTVYDSTNLTQTVKNMAEWDLITQTWSLMGGTTSTTNGTDANGCIMVLDQSNQVLYASAAQGINTAYDTSGSIVYYGVGAFNLTSRRWSKVGNGMSTMNNAIMAFDNSNSSLYVTTREGGISIAKDDRGIDISCNKVVRWDVRTQKWFGLGGHSSNGTNGQINAYAYDSSRNRMYVGGGFTKVYDLSQIWLDVSNVAAWDVAGKYWARLGSSGTRNGVDASVNALAIDSSNSRLYVGGAFKRMSDASKADQSGNCVVYWDISNSLWGQMGGSTTTTTGLDGSCNALAIDNSNGRVYVGGNFRKVSDSTKADQSANYVAYWNVNTNTWSRLGASDVSYNNGLNNQCRSLVYDPSKTQLYVGGDFTVVRDGRNIDLPVNKIAIWNPSTTQWSGMGSLGQNGTNGQILAYVYDSCKNVIYAGGSFTSVFDTSNIILTANQIAKWDIATSQWSRLGSATYNGIDGSCNTLVMDTSNQILYVGGTFNTVYDSSNTNTLTNTKRVAAWSAVTQSWSILGSSSATTNGLTSTSAYCNALAYDSSNSRLYVGGNFITVGDSSNADFSANRVAYWNVSTSRWFRIGANDVSFNNGLNLECRTLAYDQSNSQLYVGGDFTTVRDGRAVDISANKIAIWKSSTTLWSGMGPLGQNGTNGQISAYVYDSCKNVMYASGSFTTVFDTSNISGLSANRIAKWDIATSSWSRLGTATYNGLDGSCNALAMDTSNQILYAGGYFTTAYDSSNTTLTNTQRLAAWSNNTSSWSRLGSSSATTNGLTSTGAFCNALAYDSSNSLLYVGGNFTRVGDSSNADFSANNVASWNVSTSRWSKLGSSDGSANNGSNAECRTLVYDTSNSQLYVGGVFTTVRDGRGVDMSANRIAAWKPSVNKWNVVNGGFNGLLESSVLDEQVQSMVYDSCKNVIYVSGTFTEVYDSSNLKLSVNYIARWNIDGQYWSRLGTSRYNGLSLYCLTRNGLAMDSSKQILYVSGGFTQVSDGSNGDMSANYLAAWNANNESWSLLGNKGSTSNGCSAADVGLIFDNSNSCLYAVSGNLSWYDAFGGITNTGLAKWDISSSRWKFLGRSQYFFYSNTFVHDTSNDVLYISNWARGDVTDSTSTKSNMASIGIYNLKTSLFEYLGTGNTIYDNGVTTNNADSPESIALDILNQRLYVGASYLVATITGYDSYNNGSGNGVTGNGVIYWDIKTKRWNLLGNSTYNGLSISQYLQIRSIIIDSTNNLVYFAGFFTTVNDSSNGSQSANSIAAWNSNTSSWSLLGTSSSNGVGTGSSLIGRIIIDKNQNVYVGGNRRNNVNITPANDASGSHAVKNMAIWSPYSKRWSAFGSFYGNGTDASVNSIALDSSNNALYVGGNFKNVYDASASVYSLSTNYIAKLNLTTQLWSVLGQNANNGLDSTCNALAFDYTKNRLYVGGNFKKVSDSSKADQSANYIAFWDASNSLWGQLGGYDVSKNGVDASVNALVLDSNQNVFVGGNFTKASVSSGDISANKGIIWSATNNRWTHLGAGLYQNGLTDGSCIAMTLDQTYQRLYVGGSFTTVKDNSNASVSANRVAYWDLNTSSWSGIGTSDASRNGTNAYVDALAIDTSNNRLYVGGNFTKVSDSSQIDQSANYMAYWNVSTSRWIPLGGSTSTNNGTNGLVNALALDQSKNVYVGGNFTKASILSGDFSANNGVIWKTSTNGWAVLGGGLNGLVDGSCMAMALDSSNQRLYVGGSFIKVTDTSNGSLSANRIAYWNTNTSTWSALGGTDVSKNGLDGSCNALAYDNSNNRLYVGGSFKKVSDSSQIDQSANYVAFWDASNSIWKQLGGTTSTQNGASDMVNALTFDISKNIFVGGNFISVNDSAYNTYLANYNAVWIPSTQRWSRLGSIVSNGGGYSNAIEIDTKNSMLYGLYGGTLYDVSNSSGISRHNLCAWDIKNQVFVNMSNNTRTSGSVTWGAVVGVKVDYVKERVYFFNSEYNATSYIITNDSSNSSLYLNLVYYYDMKTKTFNPLGGAHNLSRTWTNGVNGDNGGGFYPYIDIVQGSKFIAMDNSANPYYGINIDRGRFPDTPICDNYRTQYANGLIIWNATTDRWEVPGSNQLNGLDAPCTSMVYDNSNQELYVSGDFTKVVDLTMTDLSRNASIPISKVAKWSVKNSRWTNIAGQKFDASNGTTGAIYASVYDSCKNIIYMGGNFTRVSDTSNGDMSANYIAAWDVSGQYWSRFGTAGNNGLNNICTALAIDSSKQILYVGGHFNYVFGAYELDMSINFVASWNISSQKWSILGASELINGLDGSCNALALDSSNSRLYVGGNFLKISDSSKADQSANYVAYWDISNSLWKKLGASDDSSNNGVKSTCRTLTYDQSNSQLYVGGDFTFVRDGRGFDMSANRIAIWKPSQNKWSGMGNLGSNGTNANILAYVYDSCKNVIYAGGSFTRVFDSSNIILTANQIAKWDIATSSWSRLGSATYNGIDGSCNTLVMDTSNQILYVGGTFNTVYDSSNTNTLTNTQRVARWNAVSQSWSRLGSSTATTNGLTSTSAYCNALAYDSSNSGLYVGGNFTTVGDSSNADLSANRVAYWNVSTSRWFRVGANDVSFNNGLNLECRTLVYDQSNSQLYVGGDFTTVRDGRAVDISANRLAIWKPSTSKWLGMGTLGQNGTNGQILAYVYDSCKNVMYASGSFTTVFDTSNIILSANRIAKWDIATSSWSQLGSSTYNGLDGACNALVMDTSNQILYAGGSFTTVYDSVNTNNLTNTQRVAKWNAVSQSWSRLGSSTSTTNGLTSTGAYCNALAYDSSNGRLYVGGNFTTVADAYNVGYSANHVAYWNVSTSNWSQLGNTTSTTNGLNLECRTLAYDQSNVQLYVGGDFTTVRDGRAVDISANRIAIWKPSTSKWSGMGTLGQNGTDGQILAYVYDSCKNVIYAGGSFTTLFDSSNIILSANRIAKWDIATSSWSTLGSATYNGLDGSCNALAMDTSNQILYAGGYFTTAYDSSNTNTLTNTQRVAAWNAVSQSWTRLGSSTSTTNGLTSTSAFCNALAYDSSNSRLYVGGNFTKVGDASNADFSANYVAYWNISTSRWAQLGGTLSTNNGVNTICQALAYDTSNTRLYVGGKFTSASDSTTQSRSANYVAYWSVSSSIWTQLGGTTSATNGLNLECRTLLYDAINAQVYVGGDFTIVRDGRSVDLSANKIAIWKPSLSRWNGIGTLGNNGFNSFCYCSAYDSCKNVIYFATNITAMTLYDSSNISLSANYLCKWDISTSTWSRLGSQSYNGMDARADSMAMDTSNQILYVGGQFSTVYDATNTSGLSVNRIAAWNANTSTWSALGTAGTTNNGITSATIIQTLLYDSSNSRLYVGGQFTTVADAGGTGILATNLVYWNISTSRWIRFGSGTTAVNQGVSDMVYSFELDGSNNKLYVAGNFTTAYNSSGNTLANRIAIWNVLTSTWSALGTAGGQNGLGGTGISMVYDGSNQRLYVCGNFTSASDSTQSGLLTNNIAYWDIAGSKWYAFGGSTSATNGLSATSYKLVLDTSNNYLYAGGNFTTAGSSTQSSISTNRVARWNILTSTWTQMGGTTSTTNGFDNNIRSAMAFDSSKNLYIAGDFLKASTTAGDISANYVVIWTSTSRWSNLGGTYYLNGITDGSCNALALDSSNQRIYVGGSFTKVKDTSNISLSANRIAYWDLNTSVWRQMGGSTSTTNGFDGSVNALAVDSNRNVFVGGNFTKASLSSGDISANKGIIWTPSSSKWTNLGATYYQNGVADLSVNALALDQSNQLLYVGGSFSRVRDSSNASLTTNRIAYFNLNTSSWNALGSNTDPSKNGLDGSCNALVFDSSNNRLYVGGNFRKVSDTSKIDQSANYVVFWDASNSLWGQMGGYDSSKNGFDGSVNALALDSNRNVFVGGNFTKASLSSGDTSANNGVIWNPRNSSWTKLGAGLFQNGVIDLSVNALALDETNQRVYVGGSFSRVRDSSNASIIANKIAYFNLNTSSWNALGSNTDPSKNGLDGSCNALAFDQTNKRLYVGGNFKKMSDTSKIDQSANYIVFWDASNSLWGQMGGSTTTTNGFDGSVNALALDSNRNVFIGGTFTKASLSSGDTSANNGVIWSPSTSKWTNIGVDRNRCGFVDGSVNALALDQTNQRLYMGGSFTRANDSSNSNLSTANVAYWDVKNSIWYGLGTTDSSKNGLNAICRTLNYNSRNTTLYAGGDFTKASDSTGYDLSANRMVAWNQTNSLWSPLGSAYRNANNGLNNSVYTISTAKNNQIFVGGTFTGGNDISGSITSNYGLIWNPSSYKWSKFGGYSGIVNDGSVNALAIDSSYTKLFIGGNFSRMSDNCGNSYTVNDGAIWNISSQTLSAMGAFNLNGLNFYPNVFAMDTYNNVLYMGGNFTSAYDASNSSSSIFAMYVIGYDITNNKWIQLGNEAWNGVTGEVTGLSFDQNNYILYVSGNYNTMFDGTNGLQSVNYIAAYNVYSKKWGRLGSSTYNGTIVAPNSIAFNGYNKLYVGGNFTSVYDSSNATLTVKYMATWDTDKKTWSRIGANTTYNGVDASVNILQYNSVSNNLLTVGNFSNINDSANTKVRSVSAYATYKF